MIKHKCDMISDVSHGPSHKHKELRSRIFCFGNKKRNVRRRKWGWKGHMINGGGKYHVERAEGKDVGGVGKPPVRFFIPSIVVDGSHERVNGMWAFFALGGFVKCVF